MKKKIVCAALLIALLSFTWVSAAFAAEKQYVKIDQIYANMPEVQVFFHLLNQQEESITAPLTEKDVSIQCDGQALHLHELTAVKEQPQEIYLLLDVSNSMPAELFKEIKKQIVALYETAAADDKLVLLTFGNDVNVVIDGTEAMEQVEETVNAIRNTDETTVLFDAIRKAIDMANASSARRKSLFVFTDGEDWAKGGNTQDEIADAVGRTGIPLYAFGVSTAKKENLDKLGALARGSGGRIEMISPSDTAEKLGGVMEYVNSGFVALASADSNTGKNGDSQVILQIGSASDSRMFHVEKWKEDVTRPTIANIEVDGVKAIVTFSEPVRNADKSAAYHVQMGKRTYSAVRVAVVSSQEAELLFEKPLYNGVYTVMAEGITDASMEKNPLSEPYELTVEGQPYTVRAFLSENWLYVVIGAAALAAGVTICVLLRRRAASMRAGGAVNSASTNGGNEKIHIGPGAGTEVTLSISGRNLVRRVVTVTVEGSILIGRSKSCDICIEDAQISRQNTALNCQNHKLYVQNLSKTNGTMLNGMAIQDMREIKSGDTIYIGDTRIMVTFQ